VTECSSGGPSGPPDECIPQYDLSEMAGRDLPFYQRLFDVCTELMEKIHRLPQPVIAEAADAQEGIGAFLEKRRPSWTGT
jgi:enoyl-CoA hydratase/carnithine racemase